MGFDRCYFIEVEGAMTSNRSQILWCALCTLVAGLCAAGLVSRQQAAAVQEGPPKKAAVFIYPEKLTSKDKLTDGQSGKPFEIKSEKTLIWVDLAPDARFSHGTEYILISAEGTRVVHGSWWPSLNGKDLFRSGKAYMVEFPVHLSGK
jgi:hypothetical protein